MYIFLVTVIDLNNHPKMFSPIVTKKSTENYTNKKGLIQGNFKQIFRNMKIIKENVSHCHS